MRTIETTVTVTPEGRFSLQLPPDIAPGEHQVVLVIDEQAAASAVRPALDLPVFDMGPWPENLSLRREDMYGDDGR